MGQSTHVSRLMQHGWLPLFQYLQGLDEEQEPSVQFKQRCIAQEEEERGRSRGRGLGLQVGGSAVAHAGSTIVSSRLDAH